VDSFDSTDIFLYHNFDIIMLTVAYLSKHKNRVVFETHLCRLLYRLLGGGGVEDCDVIFEGVPKHCDEM